MCKGKINSILKTRWPDNKFHDEGGNSWVYKTTEQENNIAIKVFRRFNNPERLPRFIHEINIMIGLKDINGITPIIDFNDASSKGTLQCDKISNISDLTFFTMPLYAGNLKSIIPKIATDDGTTAVNIIFAISLIVQELHKRGHAHRDLKPENILYDTKGNYFVSDFGLCIDLDAIPNTEERLSGSLELIGSVTYRAPELLRGRLDSSDHRPCDVFSLGRMLWALINGYEPVQLTDEEFSKTSVLKCGRNIKKPKIMDDIINGCTAIDPKFRMKIDDLITSLNNWLTENPTDSNEALIDKLINDPKSINIATSQKNSQRINEIHNQTKGFLMEELRELTKGWEKITNEYRKNTNSGNPLLIMTNHGYSGDLYSSTLGYKLNSIKNPESIRVYFNLGNIETSPLLELSIYIKLDLNNSQEQSYQVAASYISKDNYNPELLFQTDIITFDYFSSSIRQKMLLHLNEGFRGLDELLRKAIMDNR